MDVQVVHEPERHRFTAHVEGTESSLVYRSAGPGVVDFATTWVDFSVRGRGVGERLVVTALDWARSEGLTVVPSCWYVEDVVRRKPAYRDVLA